MRHLTTSPVPTGLQVHANATAVLWAVCTECLPHARGPGSAGNSRGCRRSSPEQVSTTSGSRCGPFIVCFAFQPNETWVNSPVDNCTVYHCKVETGIHILTPTPTACPDVSNCRVCAWEALPSGGPPSCPWKVLT